METGSAGGGAHPDSHRREQLSHLLARIEHADIHVPAWLRATSPENRLPVAAAIVVVVALQFRLPDRYGLHPRWLIPGLEVVLLLVLTAINPVRLNRSSGSPRNRRRALGRTRTCNLRIRRPLHYPLCYEGIHRLAAGSHPKSRGRRTHARASRHYAMTFVP